MASLLQAQHEVRRASRDMRRPSQDMRDAAPGAQGGAAERGRHSGAVIEKFTTPRTRQTS